MTETATRYGPKAKDHVLKRGNITGVYHHHCDGEAVASCIQDILRHRPPNYCANCGAKVRVKE